MSKLIEWTTQNQPGGIALTAALISAAVALIVAVISQWALSRRARRELLTKKLEELYLLLNDAASEIINRYVEIGKGIHEPERMASDDFYTRIMHGHEVQKKLVMYVKLYFPRLSHTYAAVFLAQGQLDELVNKLYSDSPPMIEDFNKALTHYGNCLGAMENEIVYNKPLLTGSSRFLRRYRTQHAQIDANSTSNNR